MEEQALAAAYNDFMESSEQVCAYILEELDFSSNVENDMLETKRESELYERTAAR